MRLHRIGQALTLLSALATLSCGTGLTRSNGERPGSLQALVSLPPSAVQAILVTVAGPGITGDLRSLLQKDPEGNWWGTVVNVPPGTDRTVTAYAYDSATVPADPAADVTGLIYRGSRTNVTVVQGELAYVPVSLRPYPDGGGGIGINTPPHLTALSHPAYVDGGGTAALTATALDPDLEAMLTYTWSDNAGGTFTGGEGNPAGNMVSGAAASVSYLPRADFVGTATITVSVTDGTATAVASFPIGVGSGVAVGIQFDLLPDLAFQAVGSQELRPGRWTSVDYTLAYPAGASDHSPPLLDVQATWTDSCGGTFGSYDGDPTLWRGDQPLAQRVTYTAPPTAPAGSGQCDLTLTLVDGSGATVWSRVVVWVSGPDAPTGKIVFVTSAATQVDGAAFGGNPSAADAFCQARADAGFALGVVPPGIYKAFLSIGGEDARDRIVDAAYLLPDWTEVAASKATLFGQNLLHAIAQDETGALAFSDVWTGSTSSGTAGPDRCADWTSNQAGVLGSVGYSLFTNWWWLADGTRGCDARASVYCFQQ